jgi:outer membrane lipoprotein SlyB
MQRSIRLVVPLLCAAMLGACAHYNTAQPNAPVYGDGRSSQGSNVAIAYGQVRSIEAVGIAKDQPHGAGAVLGGVVGAVVGRQMADSHRGENVGMVVGAVGGALIGNEIEKNARRDSNGVRVTVTLDNGSSRSFDFKDTGNLRVGDRVRIEGTQLYRI